jgi:hypothetical protein
MKKDWTITKSGSRIWKGIVREASLDKLVVLLGAVAGAAMMVHAAIRPKNRFWGVVAGLASWGLAVAVANLSIAPPLIGFAIFAICSLYIRSTSR